MTATTDVSGGIEVLLYYSDMCIRIYGCRGPSFRQFRCVPWAESALRGAWDSLGWETKFFDPRRCLSCLQYIKAIRNHPLFLGSCWHNWPLRNLSISKKNMLKVHSLGSRYKVFPMWARRVWFGGCCLDPSWNTTRCWHILRGWGASGYCDGIDDWLAKCLILPNNDLGMGSEHAWTPKTLFLRI